MRAIKIDCIKKEVYEVDIPGDNESMNKELDSYGIDMVRLSRTDALWVDGNGLHRKPPLGAFMIDGYPQALPGHGLILGLRGVDNVSTKLYLDEVKTAIRFVDVSELPLPVVTITSFRRVEDFKDYMENPEKYKPKSSMN